MHHIAENVKIIPIEQPFLRTLAKYINNKFKSDLPDLSSLLLIFPSRRNKFYFRRYLLEVSNKKGIIPPIMRTVDEIMEDIYERLGGRRGMLLNRVERNFILKKVVDSLKIDFWQDLPFLRFVSVGNRLLIFFDELSKERIAIDDIAKKVREGHYPERYIKDELPIIAKIYDAYRERFTERGYLDEIDKYETIYGQFNPGLLGDYKYIGICGLVATTAIENRIIKDMLLNLPAELIIHSTPDHPMKMNDTSHPFYQHYKLFKAVNIDNIGRIKIINGDVIKQPVYHIKKTASEAQQTFYLHNLLTRLKNRYEPHRIATILIDEDIVYSIAETLKAVGIEYNVSVGFPFTQSILYSYLSQLKEVIEKKFHYKEFFSFIKHPLLKNAVVEKEPLRQAVFSLIRKMVDNKLNYFDATHHTEEEFCHLLKLIENCIVAVSAVQNLKEYIDNLVEMLNAILLHNQEFIKTQSPDINEFFDRLTNLAKLRIPEKTIEPGIKMLEFILRILRDDTYNRQGDPMKGVQVIGFLEARNLDFDCIIMPSMNEGIFPKHSEKDLFINQPVRREVGLPYDKERENLYYYYFTEMVNGKKEVYISYVEEEKRDVRSRFIDFLVEQGVLVDESKIILESAALKIPKRQVKKDHSIMSHLYKRVGGQGLSPTALKDYKECPYRFYLKYVVGIGEPEAIVEEAGPLQWGSMIHKALSNFYKYDFPNGFKEIDLARAKNFINRRLDTAFKNELAQYPKSVSFFDLEIYKRILEKFLSNEIKRFEAGFKIDRENLEKNLRYKINVDNRSVYLNGYTDRFDMIDEKYYVIDYKTSAPPKRKYEIGDDFMEFQLPLYALILSNEDFAKIGGMAYYEISNDLKVVEICPDDMVQYLKAFQDKIMLPTIKELLDPSATFYQNDDQDACNFCIYQHVCGIKNV